MEKIGGARQCQRLIATEAGRQALRESMAPVFVDLSQNPDRCGYTNKDGFMRCLCTSSLLYSFSLDRAVMPLELLAFQGHDIPKMRVPADMSVQDMKALAGMGICLPNLAVYILAMRAANFL